MKITIDPGHGGSDSGATANGLKEKDIVLNVAKKLKSILINDYENVSIQMTRDSDVFVELNKRANLANDWGANYFVSIHVNAGGGHGFESYIYNGNVSSNTINYRSIIHDEIISQLGFYDRGKKEANFAVLRETNMPAILLENLFIDNKEDANWLKSDENLKRLAIATAEGIAKALKLKKKTSTDTKTGYYQVVTGSFEEKANAEKRVEELKKAGFDSFIEYEEK